MDPHARTQRAAQRAQALAFVEHWERCGLYPTGCTDVCLSCAFNRPMSQEEWRPFLYDSTKQEGRAFYRLTKLRETHQTCTLDGEHVCDKCGRDGDGHHIRGLSACARASEEPWRAERLEAWVRACAALRADEAMEIWAAAYMRDTSAPPSLSAVSPRALGEWLERERKHTSSINGTSQRWRVVLGELVRRAESASAPKRARDDDPPAKRHKPLEMP